MAQEQECILEAFEALRLDTHVITAGREPPTNRSTAKALSLRIRHGDGVLSRVRRTTSGVKAARDKEWDDVDEDEEAKQPRKKVARVTKPARAERDEDPNNKGRLGEKDGLAFLDELSSHISSKYATTPGSPPSSLSENIQPFTHQLRAAAQGEHAQNSRFKGMILADPPGVGKTLSLIMMVEQSRMPGDGPSVYVVPPSCARQWLEELRNSLFEGTKGVLLLSDVDVTPFDLFRYKTVITTYGRVVAEYRRLAQFEQNMEHYENGKAVAVPKRPKLTLFSGIWEMDEVRSLGRVLGLDEAHAIKNPNGRTFAALTLLRKRFGTCIMLTGTPLDNLWVDFFSLLSLLLGHPIQSMLRLREIFTSAYQPGSKLKYPQSAVPSGRFRDRLVHLLHAVMLARPPSTMTAGLPPRHSETVYFDLPADDLKRSNGAYGEYRKSMGARGEGKGYGEGDEMVKWSALIRAQQYSYHPRLVEIMELERKVAIHNSSAEKVMDDFELTEEERATYEDWAKSLREDDNSRSARVDCIIDIVNRHRDCRPNDAILLVDESFSFLDIVDAALATMDDPVQLFRYDGRQGPAERYLVMEEFKSASTANTQTPGTKVMLATRGTGGQGLNVQCANVFIRCGPWWKKTWELQAFFRIYRPGQQKPCWLYEVRANKCQVEDYKARVSDKKNKINESIMSRVILADGQTPPVWGGQ